MDRPPKFHRFIGHNRLLSGTVLLPLHRGHRVAADFRKIYVMVQRGIFKPLKMHNFQPRHWCGAAQISNTGITSPANNSTVRSTSDNVRSSKADRARAGAFHRPPAHVTSPANAVREVVLIEVRPRHRR